jgi:hypothetical protein
MYPEFAKDILAYTVTLPYGTEQFSISAQGENPYIKPVLTKTDYEGVLPDGDSLFDVNLIFTPPEEEEIAGGLADAPGYCISEGANYYVITVTSQNGEEKGYTIKVILLPDLSLSSLRVSKGEEFDIELAPLDNQTVYVHAKDGVTVSAVAKDGASVTEGENQSISGITAGQSTPVTVTVSKAVNGVTPAPQKVYKLDLHYGVKPIAEGGLLSFIPIEGDSDSYYEVHKFTSNTEGGGNHSLSFYDTTMTFITADILVVGGGGGAGADWKVYDADFPGGGGAGGLLYETGYTLTLQGGSVPVVVGAGGVGGQIGSDSSNNLGAKAGDNGGDSWIGADNNNKLTAPGGGGGGAAGLDGTPPALSGKDGGSGGGGGSGQKSNRGHAGSSTIVDSGIFGNAGGTGSNGGAGDSGGGGGGAGSAGGNGVVDGTPGAGGAGWTPGDNDAQWIYAVTEVDEFSHGGDGGGRIDNSNVQGTDGVNFGDGGSGGNNNKPYGANGHSGIVIIRFLHPPTAD